MKAPSYSFMKAPSSSFVKAPSSRLTHWSLWISLDVVLSVKLRKRFLTPVQKMHFLVMFRSRYFRMRREFPTEKLKMNN